METGRNEGSPRDFDTARENRRRWRWIVLAAVVVCVPLLVYAIATSVASRAAENSDFSESGASGTAENSAGTPNKDARPQGTSNENNAKESGYKRTAPLPAAADSCDDLRVLVDHTHELPSGYVPDDLASLESYGVSTLDAGPLLRREAARHLSRLMSEAAADGEELIIASAYRSYVEQQQTFAQFTEVYGDETDTVSAPPGQSQHQLGTAVDFTNSAASYRLWWPFGDTTASDWLLENAPDHGFVLAYPDGKEAETGYQWEPWHYRYVGIKNAKHLAEKNLTLQRFLVQEGVLPRC